MVHLDQIQFGGIGLFPPEIALFFFKPPAPLEDTEPTEQIIRRLLSSVPFVFFVVKIQVSFPVDWLRSYAERWPELYGLSGSD